MLLLGTFCCLVGWCGGQSMPPADWEHWPAFVPLLGGISSPCLQQSLKIIDALTNSSSQVDRTWAWQMMDSFGKFPRDGMMGKTIEQTMDICDTMEGFKKDFDCRSIPESLRTITIKIPVGYTVSYGSIDECLKIEHMETRYCKIYAWATTPEEASQDLQTENKFHPKLFQNLNLFPEMDYLKQNYIAIEKIKTSSEQASYDISQDTFDTDIFKGTLVEFFSNQVYGILEKNCPHCLEANIADQLPMYLTLLWLRTQNFGYNPRNVWFGGCFPSVCTGDDINVNYNTYAPRFHAGKLGLQMGTAETVCIGADMQRDQPRTSYQWSDQSKVIVPIFYVLGFLIVIGTCIDIFMRINPYKQDLPFSDSVASNEESFGVKLMKAFSLYSNGAVILSTQTGGKDVITCLHGIRFISMSWVVLGHTLLSSINSDFVDNTIHSVFNISSGGWGASFEAILNAVPSVDTFFLLSGFLVAYLTFKELELTHGVLNHVIVIVLYYVHRYIRLTIPLVLIMLIIIGILPLIASGFRWSDSAVGEAEQCVKYWKDHIGYYNNDDRAANNCMGVTWYMADDMVFFWMAPLLIYPMWFLTKRLKNVGVFLSTSLWCLLITGFTIYGGYLYAYYRVSLPIPYMPRIENWDEKEHKDYYRTWYTRIPPYLVGLMLGYVLHLLRGKTIKINPVVNVLMWQVSFLVAYSVIYGMYDLRLNGPWPLEKVWLYVAYNTLQRLAWSLSLSWVIFSCSKGSGGPVNDFLSWKFFGPLSKLTYMTYLIHFNIMNAYFGTINYSYDFTWWNFVISFLGCLSMALAFAFMLTLTVELPFIFVEKLLVGKLLDWIKSMAAPRPKTNQSNKLPQGGENGHTVDIKEQSEQTKTLPVPEEVLDIKKRT